VDCSENYREPNVPLECWSENKPILSFAIEASQYFCLRLLKAGSIVATTRCAGKVRYATGCGGNSEQSLEAGRMPWESSWFRTSEGSPMGLERTVDWCVSLHR
jgi:hypothetical protein